VCFSPDGKRILTGSADNTARVWDTETGQAKAVLKGHTNWVRSVCWSPDGTRVLTGSDDFTARVRDTEIGQEALQLGR
jgi:WD40 repeat protein